ncbi:amino acid adenylation domain-containing protein [uncultured Clostridium sp.]|uniref:amino acid adenylation domain-containing protein n=1 Tax=uncultured Clostridium sp. TaxID=59620 RepID=UPI003217BF6D
MGGHGLRNTDTEENSNEYWYKEIETAKKSSKLMYDTYSNTYAKKIYKTEVDLETSKKINILCKNNDFLMYTFLVAGLSIELYKYGVINNVALGILGHKLKEQDEIVRNKVLPLNIAVDSKFTCREYMNSTRRKILELYKYQDKLNMEYVRSKKICEDIIDVAPITINLKGFNDESSINYVCNSSKNDIAICIEKKMDNSIIATFVYNSSLYFTNSVQLFAKNYLNIISHIVNNFNREIKFIDIISQEEKNKILYDFNNTNSDYRKDKTIIEVFEEQVNKNPNNIAVVFEDKTLTYKELNEKSNQIALTLRNKGVKANSLVGIMMGKSPNMIVAILAILKSGGAYLPIDSGHPEKRIKYMLEDSKAVLLLSEKNLNINLQLDIETLFMEDDELYENNTANLKSVNNPESLAYIIYTSGSTGNPKGVSIKQRSIVNLAKWFGEAYELSENTNVLQNTNLCFDVSVEEIFGTLLNGAKIYIAKEYELTDKEKFRKFVKKNSINVVQLVPTTLQELIIGNEKLDSIKVLICGGEPLPKPMKEKVIKLGYNLYNCYGPTETSVDAITTKCVRDNEVIIGKPIANTKVYIINGDMQLLPINIPGELCISGDGLAIGYLNKPDLTEEKFIENPFIDEKHKSSIRMYRTGDIARWLPDGNIEFLGRIDNQVKIRGFRIELGEIENRLLQYEGIDETTVIIREREDGEKYLCAYVISHKHIDSRKLRIYLKESLPENMIPSYFITIEKMPLTSNGKIDKKALPEPNISEIILSDYELPRNDVERKLLEIWSSILGISRIGINDNFFELGGHSLKATVLISKIHKELNREISLKELFNSPTIKEIGKLIKDIEENPYSRIEKIEDKEYYGASSAQKRMYMLQQFDKNRIVYNMPMIFEIEGKVNKEKIESTFKKLTIRHEALRTCFKTIEDRIVQKIDDFYEFKLVHRKENEEIASIVDNFIKPFNLEKAPLFRVELVELKDKNYLLIDMHHIISDGVSMSILIKDFTSLYNGEDLEPLKLQYKDFAVWQNNFLKSEEMRKQEKYWIDRFSGEIPVLNIPTDYERPIIQSFDGDSVSFEIDEITTKALRKLSRETGATMHMVLLSAFNILLSKYSGQDDIVVGIPIAGRPHADLQNMMGMFVNTLALRNEPKGNKQYLDFLEEVKENSLNAYDNQSYQFEELVEKLNIKRDTSRNPLFDVMFNMIDTVADISIGLGDLLLNQYDTGNKVSKFDLTLNVLEEVNILKFSIDYCSKLFNKETIERLNSHYVRVLDNITNNTRIKICEINLLTETERNRMMYGFNDTKADYPKNKTIQELFEEQVEKTPDNIAVVFGDKKLTYRELNKKSNQIARILRKKGVKADSIVGIMVKRSLEMIVGIMGILKAGGAYLPIDPSYPKERIEYMLKDSKCEVLLTVESSANNIEFTKEVIDLFNEDWFEGDLSNLEKINNSSNLAYVIYTSGTTGKPKGVMIEHKALVNRLIWMQNKYPLSEKDTILQKTTYTFDVSVWELLWWSLVGAKVCMLSPNDEKDPIKIIEAIDKYSITTIHFVPSMLDIFLYCLEESKKDTGLNSLRQVFSSGEALNFKQVSRFYKEFGDSKKLINLYGPTEATIDVSYFGTSSGLDMKVIPIGKPISNIKLYILDINRNLQPVGVTGELYISGDGLARGYLNRPDLTAEKFVDNPFEVGTKMYKTGDLARWLPDGNIEFLGRIDNQVKIRGFRIELGEIESRLLEHEYIKETAVVIKENEEKEKYICAYIVSEEEISNLNLKGYLRGTLPEYMIPPYFIKIDKIPLTTNGKIDKKALPELDNSMIVRKEYIAPRNEIEIKLTKIWSKVLGIENISIDDNFFDLGGHSLKAVQVIKLIEKNLNKSINLNEFFLSPTISEVGKLIYNSDTIVWEKIDKLPESEYYECSYGQKRLWIINQMDPNSNQYNMSGNLKFNEKIDKDIVIKAIKELSKRHEAFRTRFKEIDGNVVQIIEREANIPFEFVDLSLLSSIEKCIKIKEVEEKLAHIIFDLEICPLIRVALVKIDEEEFNLIYCIHHIVFDGYSMEILAKEFEVIYNSYKESKDYELEILPIQYKDFASWQNNFIHNEEKIKEAKEFWSNQLKEEVKPIRFPVNYSNYELMDRISSVYRMVLSKELKRDLNSLAKEFKTSIFNLMISALRVLIWSLTYEDNFIIGTATFGRENADLENIIGYFVNTTIIRTTIQEDDTFKDLVLRSNNIIIKSIEYQKYPIELLLDELQIPYPEINVFFNLLNTGYVQNQIIEDSTSYHLENTQGTKFDLTIYAKEYSNGIEIICTYFTKLFSREFIEYMMNKYEELLINAKSNPNQLIKDILKSNKSRRKF